MFQVSNPLHVYSRRPDQDEDVPTLMDSSTKLQHRAKITNRLINFFLVVLIAILLVTVGLATYRYVSEKGILLGGEGEEAAEETTIEKTTLREIDTEKVITDGETTTVIHNTTKIEIKVKETKETKEPKESAPIFSFWKWGKECAGCISFDELKKKADISVKDAQDYIREKVNVALTTDIEKGGERLIVSIEDFSNQLANLPQLRDKINQLVALNKTFSKAFNEAAASQREIQALEDKFRGKVSGMENLTESMIHEIQRTYNHKKAKEEWEEQMKKIEGEIREKNQDLEREKQGFVDLIKEIEQKMRGYLSDIHADSERDLKRTIENKEKAIENIKAGSVECKDGVPLRRDEIRILTKQYNEMVTYLEEINVHLNQLAWVRHVLETIRKFELIRTKLEELRDQQLITGQENFESLLESVRQKEDKLINALNKPENFKAESVQQSTTRTETGEATRTVYRSYEQTTSIDVSSLRNAIKQEKNLLQVWAYEQFNIFNISTNEINNVTNTIKNLEASIIDQSPNFIKYETQKTETKKVIDTLVIQLRAKEQALHECEDIIENGEKKAENLNSELQQLRDSEAKIGDAHTELQQQRQAIQELEAKHDSSIQSLKELKQKLKDRISGEDRDSENQLESLTRSINEKIISGPKPEVLEREFERNKAKIQRANELYQELVALVEDIKRIV